MLFSATFRWEIHHVCGGAQRVRLTWHVCRTTLAPYQGQNQMSNHRQSSSWESRRAVKAGLDSLNSYVCVCELQGEIEQRALGGLESGGVNCEYGNRRFCLLRTGVCTEAVKAKYLKHRNHGSWRRNAHHSVWRCPLGLPPARGFRAEKTPSSVKGRTLRCELWEQSCSAELDIPTELGIFHYCKGIQKLLTVAADLKRKNWVLCSSRVWGGLRVLE